MNISSITLRDLEYLIAVAAHRHFGRAAQSVHVSQPALSAQIRKIEDILQMKLFERTNRRVVITDTGRKVVAQAQVVMEEAGKIATLVARRDSTLSGSLMLGAIFTLGPYYLPHILAPLKREFPALELHLKEGLTANLIGDLRSGELDVVLASPTFPSDGLEMFPLFFEPFLLLAPRQHALASREPLRATDLRANEMVLLEDGHCLKDQSLEFCPRNRRGQARRFHATSIETLRHLVATGHGYTLIPSLAAKNDRKLRSLVQYRPFLNKSVGREVVLVCRKGSARRNDFQMLAEFLRHHAETLWR